MSNQTRSTILKASAAAIGMMTLVGCATNPQEAVNIAKPKTLPARNLTNFSESLRCMDELFLQFGRSDMVITSAGIPDETAVITAGTKDMLISAISRMSRKSDAFTFVDYDATQTDVHDLQGLAGFSEDFVIPDFYIRGAITQLDDAVVDRSVSAQVGYDAGYGGSEDSESESNNIGFNAQAAQTVAVVSLDLNIGDLVTRQIVSGISAHNSIAVARNSVQGGLGGQIYKLGASFEVALSKGEGIHQAVRTLIELSTIEVLGKLAEVPFWTCLKIDHTNPAIVAESKAWFDGMSKPEQISFVQETLASKGLFNGAASGALDAGTRDAVARYQAQNSLIADGRINFDLYASLLNYEARTEVAATAKPVTTRAVQTDDVEEAADIEATLPLNKVEEPVVLEEEERLPPLILNLVSDETDGNYEVDRELHFSVSTNLDAHIYCYYADAVGNVARIFPNQFQPDSFNAADDSVSVPSEDAGFDIILDQAGADERVACVASTKELALRLPAELKMPDLTPIPNRSIDDIVDAYRDLDRENVVLARLDLKVR